MPLTPKPFQLPDPLPATVDVQTAARWLGIGRTTAYQLARQNRFPCRTIRAGNRYRIPTADLLTLLGLTPPPRTPDIHPQR